MGQSAIKCGEESEMEDMEGFCGVGGRWADGRGENVYAYVVHVGLEQIF